MKPRMERFRFGPWEVECLAEDGARLGALRFAGVDLLTPAPADFRPPAANCGAYETRPVYGYDDCFPTVDPCPFPGRERCLIADHGELCWLGWRVEATDSRLRCHVSSRQLPAAFSRTLVFGERSPEWQFEIRNEGDTALPCLHVMHALMPLDRVTGLSFPSFDVTFDEMNDGELEGNDPKQFAQWLLARPRGTAEMILLRGIGEGRFTIAFREGPRLEVGFPANLFPTLGIWWNHAGYPDEDGCRRMECAVEPIAGTASSLAGTYRDGVHLTVRPRRSLRWSVHWKIG